MSFPDVQNTYTRRNKNDHNDCHSRIFLVYYPSHSVLTTTWISKATTLSFQLNLYHANSNNNISVYYVNIDEYIIQLNHFGWKLCLIYNYPTNEISQQTNHRQNNFQNERTNIDWSYLRIKTSGHVITQNKASIQENTMNSSKDFELLWILTCQILMLRTDEQLFLSSLFARVYDEQVFVDQFHLDKF
jgi:hypothetical protein